MSSYFLFVLKRRKNKIQKVPLAGIVGLDKASDIGVKNNSPIPLFNRVRKVWLDGNSRLYCTCGHF